MLSHVFCDPNNIFINLINILKLRGLTMEATDFDKIADKIMQFRGKIPKYDDRYTSHINSCTLQMLNEIDHFLEMLDAYARCGVV